MWHGQHLDELIGCPRERGLKEGRFQDTSWTIQLNYSLFFNLDASLRNVIKLITAVLSLPYISSEVTSCFPRFVEGRMINKDRVCSVVVTSLISGPII